MQLALAAPNEDAVLVHRLHARDGAAAQRARHGAAHPARAAEPRPLATHQRNKVIQRGRHALPLGRWPRWGQVFTFVIVIILHSTIHGYELLSNKLYVKHAACYHCGGLAPTVASCFQIQRARLWVGVWCA